MTTALHQSRLATLTREQRERRLLELADLWVELDCNPTLRDDLQFGFDVGVGRHAAAVVNFSGEAWGRFIDLCDAVRARQRCMTDPAGFVSEHDLTCSVGEAQDRVLNAQDEALARLFEVVAH